MNTYCRVLGSVLVIAVFIPVSVSAITADELRVQIQTLLNQVKALEQQLATLTAAPVVPTTPIICTVPSRTLSRGSVGSDVISLQQFLISQGLLSGSSTGYFGTLTEAALKQWQAQQGIVTYGDAATTGYGVLGVRTRAALSMVCTSGISTTVSGSFSASPTSGTKPLSVTFTGLVSGASYPNGIQINFGDGATGILCAAGVRCVNATLTHTYTAAGTYTATLRGVDATKGSTTLGSMQVVVTNEVATVNATSFALSSTSGTAPLVVTATIAVSQNNVPSTSSITVGTITWGDGRSDAVTTLPGSGQISISVSHSYSTAGTYTVTFTPVNGGSVTNTVTVNAQTTTCGPTQSCVPVPVSSNPTLTFTAPLRDQTVRQGDVVTLIWRAVNIPSDAKMLITLRNAAGRAIKSVAITNIAAGSYTSTIPTAAEYCNAYFSDVISPCGALTPGNYYISAAIVTPANACVGYCDPMSPRPTTLTTADTTMFSLVAVQ